MTAAQIKAPGRILKRHKKSKQGCGNCKLRQVKVLFPKPF